MENRSDRRPIRENNLVSEQPGFFILFLGLFISIVVGFSIRTAARSDWFHLRLREAISNVGKDWRIEHGDVGLYFKDGIKPTIGVYIENVKIASESRCFMKSGGFAQTVKIPLSLINYLVDGELVSDIEIQDFKVEVTDKSSVCHTSDYTTERPAYLTSKKKNQITIVDRVERSQLRNEIQRIKINKLEIFFPQGQYDYFLLRDIVITNKSSHPKILFLEGGLDMNSLVKTGDSNAVANLKIEYNEFPEKIIKSNLLGSLREGFFSLQLVNRLDDEKFQMQAELKNVSLSFLKRFDPEIPGELNLKSNWLSMKLYSEGSAKAVTSSSVQLKDILINGDLGEVSVDDVSFPNGFQKNHNGFDIQMRNISLSKATRLVPSLIVPDQIDDLGIINGKLTIASASAISFVGEWLGLAVVFSAKGVRKTEKLNFKKLIGNWKNSKFLFESNDMYLDSKNLDGFFRAKSSDMKNFDIESHLKGVGLSQSTSELVTGSEQPIIFDDLFFNVKGNQESARYKIAGKFKSFFHQYFSSVNTSFVVNGFTDGNQDVDIKADLVQYTDELQKILTRFDITLPLLNNKPRVRFSRVSHSLQLKYETSNQVKMNALLGSDGQLNGVITTKDRGWKIYGTRNDIKVDKK